MIQYKNMKKEKFRKAVRNRAKYVIAFVFTLVIAAAAVFAFTTNDSEGNHYYDDDTYVSITIAKGQPLENSLPIEPQLADYIFSHWSTTPDGAPIDLGQRLYEDAVFYAIWRAYETGYDYEYEYGYEYDNNSSYEDYFSDDDAITVIFIWNRGGRERTEEIDDEIYNYHNEADYDNDEYDYYDSYIGEAPYAVDYDYNDSYIGTASFDRLTIISDAHANISLDRNEMHMVTIYGHYIFVCFPQVVDFDLIGVVLPEGWSYTIEHISQEFDEYELEALERLREQEDLAHLVPEIELSTRVTIRHTLLDNFNPYEFNHETIYLHAGGSLDRGGFMPFADDPPATFTIVPLDASLGNQGWINANNIGGNIVITVPHDIDMAANFTFSGNRHIIVTSYGTDLNFHLYNHSLTGTPFVITHTGNTRHFTQSTTGNILSLSHIVLDGNVHPPTTTYLRGGITVANNTHLNLLSGSIIRNSRLASGGAVSLAGAGGNFTMRGNASITNNSATASGGGIVITGARQSTILDNATISHNQAPLGAGVSITAAASGGNPQLTISDNASIHNNIAATSGGGINIGANGAIVTMNGGSISHNTANGTAITAGGGGVFLAAGANSRFNFNGGTINDNHAVSKGGGIFASTFTSGSALPTVAAPAVHFPQLNIALAANFINNTSNLGGVIPPINATTYTNISVTNQISDGRSHPLNNLDINFVPGDWVRLNNLIGTATQPTPDRIIIHPTGALGVTPGLDGTDYHLVITDPGNGSTITTLAFANGAADSNAHMITVPAGRNVTIEAALGANITIRMPAPGAPNTPNQFPWITTLPTLVRHFNVANGGNLTIGGGPGTGNLVLNGNANEVAATIIRGGVSVAAGGALTLAAGGHIHNNRAATGGGVQVTGSAANAANLAMTGGSIMDNVTTGTGAANSGGGVALNATNSHFTMSGGRIAGNTASSTNASGGGGGIALTAAGARFIMTGGFISDNTALHGGGVLLHPHPVNLPHSISGGYIYDNHANGSGGGINVMGATTLNMSGGTIGSAVPGDNNHANVNGGGVAFSAANSRFNMTSGTIIGNTATIGGGVLLNASPADNPHIISGGNIIGNTASTNGGGVALNANNSRLTMESGNISGNFANGTAAANGGGGVFLVAGAGSNFTFEGGAIHDNAAVMNGGGIFTTPSSSLVILPAGSYPQLNIYPAASFMGNIAGGGSFAPPYNAVDATNIAITASRSGGHPHALNNLDINFSRVVSDWALINSLINSSTIENIVIHPTGALGITHGISGTTFNLVISDLGDGNTITTVPVVGTVHGINVLRTVTIQAAPGANIILAMTATTPVNLGRHFVVGVNGNLTIGGAGSGNLRLDGGTAPPTSGTDIRGGISVAATAAGPSTLTLAQGGHITNSRAATGGGVIVTAVAAQPGTFHMTGGSITHNTTVGTAAANSGGGVALHSVNSNFVMSGGVISDNIATGTAAATSGGGGVALTSTVTAANPARFTMTGGRIVNNTGHNGGGIMLHPNPALYPHIISGGYIYDNHANNNGGGISVMGATTLNMFGGTIGSATIGLNNHANQNGGGVSVTANGILNISGTGSIIGNTATVSGGGVAFLGAGFFNMNNTAIISGNIALGTATTAGGGGVAFTAASGRFVMEGGTISGNTGNIGGGVLLHSNAAGVNHLMTAGNITGNTANTSGGGVALNVDNTRLAMENGNISGNFANGTAAANGGGGVFLAVGAGSNFTFENGTIHNNTAVMNGGGIFTSTFTHSPILPVGAYPQLNVYPAASFSGNTAGGGNFAPPYNAVDATNIAVTMSRSGGHPHALNNLDINFSRVASDWLLINSIISTSTIDTIVIHPTGALGVTHGISGTTFNLVISDPCPYGDGRVITTVPVTGTTTAHNINIPANRTVAIEAAPGSNIIIRMPTAGASNTPNIPPWATTQTTLVRHFTVLANGHLTIGGGPGSGNLTLDGNASLVGGTIIRGGISVAATAAGPASLTLREGGIIHNNRAATGGGVQVNAVAAHPGTFTMTGGSITNNFTTGTAVANSGGGVALHSTNTHFTMSGGIIENNHATASSGTLPGGGGVALTSSATNSRFTMTGGRIRNNFAAGHGGGVLLHPNHVDYPHIFSGGYIYDNHANNNGGGVAVAGVTTLNMSGGTIGSLVTGDNNHSNTNGGGIAITAGGTLNLSGGNIIGNTANTSGGGVAFTSNGQLNMSESSVISGNFANGTATTAGGGGVAFTAAGGRFNMTNGTISGNTGNIGGGVLLNVHLANNPHNFSGGSITGNTANTSGGGVMLAGANALLNMSGATTSISGNFANGTAATAGGAGVAINNTGLFTMESGSIAGNIAASSGGGVALITNGARFTMENGSISGNTANGTLATVGGGGVFLIAGANSNFTMENGSIHNNHAVSHGGGIHTRTYAFGLYIAPGSFPQLNIHEDASFNGNTSGQGGFNPPGNAHLSTNVAITASSSGTHWHPINNLDINFPAGGLIIADWTILNAVVNSTTVDTVIIHPTGTTGVNEGIDGSVYNLIISDPCPYGEGRVITTIPLTATVTAHNINVPANRTVTIQAAPGADIIVRMPTASATNTPDIPPWATIQTALARHFTVAAGGHLTVGGGLGSGLLTLDGNANLVATNINRGGISVTAAAAGPASLTLNEGGRIFNNRAATGGGVQIAGNATHPATFTMHGGSITNNFTNGTGVANSGGGVALSATNSHFNLNEGSITGNTSTSTNVDGGGGGVAFTNGATNSRLNMTGGIVSSNTANNGGGVLLHGSTVVGFPHTISGGYIYDNTATTRGGGIAILGASTILSMTGGRIGSLAPDQGNKSNSTVVGNGGGGIFINTGIGNQFNMSGGHIVGNHSNTHGGGIFTSMFTLANPLPMGAYPQLTIEGAANFYGNTANSGSFTPPFNAVAATQIEETNQVSGGYAHPLNNLDINFQSIEADWFRLSSVMNGTTATTIVIFPTHAPSLSPGLQGTTYNFNITDPGDGYTITTVPLDGMVVNHNINVLRSVNVQAAPNTEIVLRMPVSGAPNTPNEAPWLTTTATLNRHFIVLEGHTLTIGGGSGTGSLILDGNADLTTGNRGGVGVNAGGTLVLQNRGAITNGRMANGGGVSVLGAAGLAGTVTMSGGRITDNYAATSGGGVALTAANAHLNMSGGYISHNNAGTGGGVAITVNGGQFNMNGGTINNNIVTGAGGGVHLVVGGDINFNFTGGMIRDNHAAADGGGVFTAAFTYGSPLPTGAHFPQLNIQPPAAFNNNSAGNGGFAPPPNAAAVTQISGAVPASGGFSHPLNNLDINFLPNDWNRLNVLIDTSNLPNPGRIIIHPTGVPGVDSGLAPDGITYNFIITDPGNGSTITTVPIVNVGVSATDPHRINVLRPVIIEAAPGANIVLDMTAAATPVGGANIGRHFHVGNGGNLILGGGPTSGTLTLNGNAGTREGNRGGVTVNNAGGNLELSQGGVIQGGRAISGGGVELSINGATFTLDGGTISGNFATGTAATQGGGGVFIAGAANTLSHFTFESGSIINNHSAGNGGGIFASMHTYQNPLPDAGVPHFPQLTVSGNAVFSGNTANGAAVPPPNAASHTHVEYTPSSGGFSHALNNLDINFFFLSADWARLDRLISTTTIPNIIIHPSWSGVTPGLDILGTTYNFVITDPHPDPFYAGRTITTIHLQGGTTASNINITNRMVSIMAADDEHIVIRMPLPGAPNTPALVPWITTASASTRHFTVIANGNLSLGGIGTGTLTLDGNGDAVAVTRGGISVSGAGPVLNLLSGTIIRNNRRVGTGGATGTGGGVSLEGTSIVNMYDGVLITENFATNGGGGIGFSSMGLTPILNMHGGTISNNHASWGGGIWLMAGVVNMYGGVITGNYAGIIGTQSPFESNTHGGGGAIRVCCGGRLFMHDGTISYNTGRHGGGVHLSHSQTIGGVEHSAVFVMRGGNLIGNHASLDHIDPAVHHPAFPNNKDGGGVFITESGIFTMANPVFGNLPNEIHISHNIADRHGGGVFYEVGIWETDERNQPVVFEGNEAKEDGGGIFLSYKELEMFGEWRIDGNSATRGGGVFIHGDATPWGNTGTWHHLRGPGHLTMHGGRFYQNHSHTSGGGVYIYRDGAFFMHDGYIQENTSEIFGGGVYVFNPGTYYTARFHAYGGTLLGNRAIYGGAVYLMYRAHLFADDVLFYDNHAERMGGAIFTELVDYGYLLSGEDVPHDILFPTPPDPNEVFNAFDNIVTTELVRFDENTAIAPFHKPYNAYLLTNIKWALWDTNPYEHLSLHLHPLNNYDINYVRPVYFYKTDMEVYSFPATINNRGGAVFELDMEVWCDNANDYIWELYTTATSQANGRIALFVFHTGNFRLREVAPPPGPWYRLPPGHWYLEMALEAFEGAPGVWDDLLYIVNPPPATCPLNTEFFFVQLDRETYGTPNCEGSQAERLRWHVGNAPPRAALHLHKTGQDLFEMASPTQLAQIEDILVEGAIFRLYRYTGVGTPTDTLVPAPGWVRVGLDHTSSGDPDYPIVINLSFRADGQDHTYYQLVEIVPPPNYSAPLGQWRIRMDIIDHVIELTTISWELQGDRSTPHFIRLTGETGYVFAVGNRVDFNLPMTGGLGQHGGIIALASVGVAMIAAGGLVAYMVIVKKKWRKPSMLLVRKGLDE
ncbi:MAG: hypothetical protein FWC73_02010 [Defluviitaleaceae bacterium]|nr:hypothetical protein [Defluviitaleaceae bacterium]